MTVRDLLPLFCFGFDGIEPPEDLCALLRQGLGGVIATERTLDLRKGNPAGERSDLILQPPQCRDIIFA